VLPRKRIRVSFELYRGFGTDVVQHTAQRDSVAQILGQILRLNLLLKRGFEVGPQYLNVFMKFRLIAVLDHDCDAYIFS
jgi:hypothetical protein